MKFKTTNPKFQTNSKYPKIQTFDKLKFQLLGIVWILDIGVWYLKFYFIIIL